MEAFRELLGERLRARGATAELARRSGLSPTLIGRWERGETRPSDANLRKLAPAIGVPYEDLLRMCGYLPTTSRSDDDPIEQYIRQGTALMHDVLADTPRPYWATIIKLTFDRAIDGARDMAQLVSEDQSAVRSVRNPADAANRRRSGRPNRHADGGAPEITAHSLGQRLVLATP